MSDRTVNFSVLCDMFEAIVRSKNARNRYKHIRTFLQHVYKDREYFSAIRLILPALDRERGTYGLKEAVLAKCLTEALGLSKDSQDAQRLLNWRKGGAKVGASAGNFGMVATEVLYRRQRVASGGLKIKEVNDLLDRLASVESREAKTKVLAELINKTNALEMKWIVMIILKDLKLGVSEKGMFHEFHPDAEDMFNVTCDLKLVCEKLNDRSQRYKRQDIEVGKAVRPQLALRVANVETAWRKLHGKQVVVECKFDGDRIQVHKNGQEVHFFSRNFVGHTEYECAISSIILQNVQADKCILDGEMLVWDKGINRFADFGSNQEIAKAAREGLETNQQLCYVAFDILYVGDTSVIHQSLRERHHLLRQVVKPLKGRLELLLPEDGVNSHSSAVLAGEPCWSFVANNAEEVAKFFQETVENRDEGIILKDLDSKWEPSDRSGKWLKLKPDYINTGSDLDVLIIGGYFGSGRHGGEVAQFLLGLAEGSRSGGHPIRFLSFCKVGSGLSDEECNVLVSKLKPYFRPNEKNSKIPSFYTVTNNAKERPDVWIDPPEKSIILEITSDVRTIKSEVFASPYSLRFPRIHRVRYDKPWYECLDVHTFMDLVQSQSGTILRANNYGNLDGPKPKRMKHTSKGEKKMFTVVPSYMLRTDVSDVKQETLIFKNSMFYIVNVPSDYSVEKFHKMVVENGGLFSMNLNDSVTHIIAADKKGIKYQAASKHGDVIHYSWIIDCCKAKSLLPLRPKYFLCISGSSKEKMKEDIDEFGDHLFWDLDVPDLKQIFHNIDGSKLSRTNGQAKHYIKKYCPSDKWCQFLNCCIYFHRIIHSINVDSQTVSELTLQRLKLEVSMHGGSVTSTLAHATHVIVFSAAEFAVPFKTILESFTTNGRNLIQKERIHILSHLWLEDSLKECRKLPESTYSLKANLDVHQMPAINEIEGPTMSIEEVDPTSENIQQQPEKPKRNDEPDIHSAGRKGKQIQKHHRRPRKTPVRRGRKALIHDNNSSDGNASNDEVTPRKCLDLEKPASVGGKCTGLPRRLSSNLEEGKHIEEQFEQTKSSHGSDKRAEDENLIADYASMAEEQKLTTNDGSQGLRDNIDESVQAMLMDMIPGFALNHVASEDPSLVSTSDPPKESNSVCSRSNVVTQEKKKRVSYRDIIENMLDGK